MPEQSHAIDRLAYEIATHAPLRAWYDLSSGDFVEVGDDPAAGKPWRLDPETGEEIHAIQRGEPHHYSTDYKVGSSYPKTTWVFGDRPDGEPASHEKLEEFLRENGLFSDALSPVMVPKGPGELRAGFMFRPPERAPYNLDSIKKQIHRRFDLEEHDVLGNDRGFQAFIG